MKNEKQVSHPAVSRSVAAVAAMLATLMVGQAQASGKIIDLDNCLNANLHTFGAIVGGPITSAEITVGNAKGDVYMEATGTGCTKTPTTFDCSLTTTKFHVNGVLTAQPQATAKTTVTWPGLAAGDEYYFKVTGTDAAVPNPSCLQQYRFHVAPPGAVGGWGDPHLTTFDGTHYDFQSAGEFTALRSDDLEIQTRQIPIPSAGTHCVAVIGAMAARVGSSKVSLQPQFGAGAERKPMQLRVNGKEVTLTNSGIELSWDNGESNSKKRFDGRIKKADGGAIEIVAADGTQIVVTPTVWDAHLWHLNVQVFQSAAHEGTMGLVPQGSWLPRLPDGTSLGPKPTSEDDIYDQLYERFADAWRITNDTSLFKYEAGTNTATFTLDEWPRKHPQSCDIAGQTSAQPTTTAIAEQACAAVTGPTEKADCIFDVAITGNLKFAKSYEVMQKFKPQGPGWQSHVVFPSGDDHPHGKISKKWWWLLLLLLLLQ